MRKVFVWGTGKDSLRLLKNGLFAEVLGFVETYKKQEFFCGRRVYKYTEIPKEYDAIIVANNYSNQIFLTAKNRHLDINKMIFLFPCAYIDPKRDLDWINSILGEKNFNIYLGTYGFYEKTFFANDKEKYQTLNTRDTFKIDESIIRPIIKDKFEDAGVISNYFWQDLWAARLIFQNKPKEHYDIGSRLDGFIAHVLSYGIPVNMIDIRPFPTEVEGLKTIVDDATDMKQFKNESLDSLSALCSLEHFGLGRYGDLIDPEACFKCFNNIQKK